MEYNLSNISKLSASQLIPENIFLYDIDCLPHICQVEIDPIDNCNHSCEWCFTAEYRYSKKVSLTNLKKYLSAFCNLGGKSVVFSGGGEPLLYKEIYTASNEFDNKSICKYLVEKSVSTGIITNGQLLNNLFDSDFSLNDLSFIRVSLDATNEIMHSKLHKVNKSSFFEIINNIRSILQIRGNQYTPAIGISFVVDPKRSINFSKSQIEDINKLACNLKVDFVQFKHIHTSEKVKANESMRLLHSHCVGMNWQETEFWVQSYTSPNSSSQCLISQYIQSIGGQSKRFPCCHLFGKSQFLDQEVFLPKGDIITHCNSRVCRYGEMNNLLSKNSEEEITKNRKILQTSIMMYGFHPYRYCPTAPYIFKPFKSI